MISKNSTVGQLYKTPVGHDVLNKLLLQTGMSEKAILNPIVSHLKLKTLPKIAGKMITDDMLDSIVNLVNIEKDVPGPSNGSVSKKWWKEAVFYQIYPRTFNDANGDDIGDLKGITDKLDYLKDLGVDALWLSPIYDSPNDDNGYDIRDYRKINEEFGTMEDFDRFLDEAHKRNIKVIMDLVVNHTSDEHEWFKKALNEPDSKYRNYYFIKEDDKDTPPNNWLSFFSGSAWNRYEDKHLWALHLFSKKQMDLNWDCPDVRNDVADMVNWWLDKGIDGFRMDVISCISKEEGLPDGNDTIGSMMGFRGIEHYFYGPHLHEYLRELHEKAFAPHNAFSVGETPGLGMQMAKLITGEERKELDMIFSFDQLETPGHTRFEDYEYDLNYYKKYITDWMLNYGNNCWMSLFYNNHDNPRMASKVTKDAHFQKDVMKLLAVMQFTLKGTPFIFQGDEMGLTNYVFKSMDQITDIESKNLYRELIEKGKSEDEAFNIIISGTREHARINLPWPGKESGSKDLYIPADDDITKVYKELISLRKAHKDALVYGDFKVIDSSKDRFVYKRIGGGEEFIVECNLGQKMLKKTTFKGYFAVYDSCPGNESGRLKPYEAVILKRQ